MIVPLDMQAGRGHPPKYNALQGPTKKRLSRPLVKPAPTTGCPPIDTTLNEVPPLVERIFSQGDLDAAEKLVRICRGTNEATRRLIVRIVDAKIEKIGLKPSCDSKEALPDTTVLRATSFLMVLTEFGSEFCKQSFKSFLSHTFGQDLLLDLVFGKKYSWARSMLAEVLQTPTSTVALQLLNKIIFKVERQDQAACELLESLITTNPKLEDVCEAFLATKPNIHEAIPEEYMVGATHRKGAARQKPFYAFPEPVQDAIISLYNATVNLRVTSDRKASPFQKERYEYGNTVVLVAGGEVIQALPLDNPATSYESGRLNYGGEGLNSASTTEHDIVFEILQQTDETPSGERKKVTVYLLHTHPQELENLDGTRRQDGSGKISTSFSRADCEEVEGFASRFPSLFSFGQTTELIECAIPVPLEPFSNDYQLRAELLVATYTYNAEVHQARILAEQAQAAY